MRRSIVPALVATVLLAPSPSPASETPPPTAQELVQAKLLAPLSARETPRIRFTRAALPPRVRRVRIVDAAPLTDETGAAFVRFAVDESHGFVLLDGRDDPWQRDALTGCAYPDRGLVFVKRGERLYPVEILLGRKVAEAPPGTCRERPAAPTTIIAAPTAPPAAATTTTAAPTATAAAP